MALEVIDMRTGRSPFAMRLTDTGKQLLEQLAERRGISQTSVVEQLIRDEAERVGVKIPAKSITENDNSAAEITPNA